MRGSSEPGSPLELVPPHNIFPSSWHSRHFDSCQDCTMERGGISRALPSQPQSLKMIMNPVAAGGSPLIGRLALIGTVVAGGGDF